MSVSESYPASRAAPAESIVLVSLLGEVATRRGETLVPLPGARSRSLLAALAMRPGRSRSAQALIEDVWADAPPRSPMNALHTQVSRLRSALPEGALEIGPSGYRLAIGPESVDLSLARVWERRAAQSLAEGSPRDAVELVSRARGMWTGVPGADLPDGELREQVRGEASRCLDALIGIQVRASIEAGDHAAALPLARRAAAAEPTDEDAHIELMRALHGVGRTNEALEVYAALSTRLADRLGTDPSPRISVLHSRLLREGASRAVAEQTANPAPGVPLAIGLRASPNPLIGRDDDLDAIADLTRKARVTTVLGPGGTGKTRVAHEIGTRFAATTPVVLVELASLRSGEDVVTAIGGTLGLSETDLRYAGLPRARVVSARKRLRESLAIRPMLLILDNCEHVIADVADVVADLVAAAPNLTVLATSRAPMAIMAESVYLLPPLIISDHGSPATDLFCSRARAVRSTVALDPVEVATLCRRLDGLPLAIELAAARVRTMSVEEINVRLAHRFALLKSGDPTSPARHRTLRSVIEWSWNLLDAEQQIALRRLCRFPAGFTLSAAEVVAEWSGPAGDLDDVATAIDGLVGQSMLSVVERPGVGLRYHMLETVREYGEEQLAEADSFELSTLVAKTTSWVRAFAAHSASGFMGIDQVPTVYALEAEHDNVLAALRFADSEGDVATVVTVFPVLASLWSMRGAHSEVISWAPKIVALNVDDPALADVPDDFVVASLLFAASHMLFAGVPRGLARARTQLRRAVALRTATSTNVLVLARIVVWSKSFRGLPRYLAEASGHPDPSTRVMGLMARASIRENSGNLEGALRDDLRALTLARQLRDTWSISMLTQNIGSIHSQSGRYSEAIPYYEECSGLLALLHAYEESTELDGFLCCALVGAGRIDEARDRMAAMAGGSLPDPNGPSVPPDGQVRNAALSALASTAAEIAFADGDIDAGLAHYRRAVDLAGGPTPIESPDPGSMMTVCAALAAHAEYDRCDDVRAWVPQLASAAVRRLGPGGYPDFPQIGSVAVAVGSYLIASGDDATGGLRLLVLGFTSRGRQDSPTLAAPRRRAAAQRALGVDAVAAALASVAPLSRAAVRREVLSALEVVGGH